MNTTEYLSKWAISYKDDIINNIMPFWMKYGLDREHGGVYTCVNRDGSLMDTTKSVWFQGRFGFIAAYAYNNIEKNPQWLAASKVVLILSKHIVLIRTDICFLKLQKTESPCVNAVMCFLKVLLQ